MHERAAHRETNVLTRPGCLLEVIEYMRELLSGIQVF